MAQTLLTCSELAHGAFITSGAMEGTQAPPEGPESWPELKNSLGFQLRACLWMFGKA